MSVPSHQSSRPKPRKITLIVLNGRGVEVLPWSKKTKKVLLF